MSIPVLPMQRAQVPVLSGQQGVGFQGMQQYPIPTYVGNGMQGVGQPATHNPYELQQQQQQQQQANQQQLQQMQSNQQQPGQVGAQSVVAMQGAIFQHAAPTAVPTSLPSATPVQNESVVGQPLPIPDNSLLHHQQLQQQQHQQQVQRVQHGAGVQITQAPQYTPQGLVPSFPVFSVPTLQNTQAGNMLPMGVMNVSQSGQQILPSFPVMSVPALPAVHPHYQSTAPITTLKAPEVESDYPSEARDYPGQGAWPEGLAYIPNFITEEEEKWLVQYAYSSQWDEQGKMNRRVCQYGFSFDYESGNKLKKGKPMPTVFQFLIDRITKITEATPGRGAYPVACEDSTPWIPNQVIVNEYLPGQGIGMHIDKPQLFDQNILTLILHCPVALKLIPKGPRKRSHVFRELLLKKRSIFCLSGPSRYTHQHGIPSTKIDVVNGVRNKRGTCIAITFRRVLPNATISD